jgi:hypothetical protein
MALWAAAVIRLDRLLYGFSFFPGGVDFQNNVEVSVTMFQSGAMR